MFGARLRALLLVLAPGVGAAAVRSRSTGPPGSDDASAVPPGVEQLYADAKDDMASGSYDARHQDAGARRRPRRRHAAGAAGPARPGLCLLAQRRTCAGAGDARTLHQAATRRARRWTTRCTCGLINFNDNLGVLGSLAGQDLSERDQQASRDAYQPSSNWSTSSRIALRRRCARCAWTTSSTRWPTTRCMWRATTSAAAPMWPRSTGRSRRWRSSSSRPRSKRRCTSWCRATTGWAWTTLRDDADRVLREELPEQHASSATACASAGKAWWQFW